MARTAIKRFAKELCPPLLWRAARSLVPPAREGNSARVVTSLEQLDQELRAADRAGQVSDDALRAALSSFRFQVPVDLPADPYSPAYRRAQFDLYRLVSGREYAAEACEKSDFDFDDAPTSCFPYSTGSSTTLGEQLMAIGFLTRALELRPEDRILEFGPGWGKTTIELVQLGFAVTAVDIYPRFVELIRKRCEKLGLAVEAACSDMLTYVPNRRFDRVVFYECFHHCADHVAMVRRLDELVAPGGRVVFAGEPIHDEFPCPWGLRLDGQAVRAIRQFGWLELGFRTDYFLDLMARHGWAVRRLASADVPWQTVFVARRLSETS